MKSWRPITRPRPTRLRRAVTVAAIVALATGTTAALTTTPASALTPGTLTNVSLTVSNNAANVSGTGNTATYTWAFTAGSTGVPSSITFTVPSSTALASPTTTLYGLTGCSTSGTPAVSSGTVTLNLSSCSSLASGTPAVVTMSGFTNATSAASGFKSTVTTTTDNGTSGGDTGQASTGVDFNDNTTGVTVVVPESLTFSNNGPSSITLVPVPGSAPVSAAPVSLGVTTNAKSGYTLGACVTSDIHGHGGAGNPVSTVTIPQGIPAAGFSLFGATAAVTAGTTAGTFQFGSWAAADTAPGAQGYPGACGTTAGTGDGTITDGGPASGDTITITNSVSASAVQPAGQYDGIITYVASPHY